MKKSQITNQKPYIEVSPGKFKPTDEQIKALAHRLMPEIKKYFTDEHIRQEFVDWLRKQKTVE